MKSKILLKLKNLTDFSIIFSFLILILIILLFVSLQSSSSSKIDSISKRLSNIDRELISMTIEGENYLSDSIILRINQLIDDQAIISLSSTIPNLDLDYIRQNLNSDLSIEEFDLLINQLRNEIWKFVESKNESYKVLFIAFFSIAVIMTLLLGLTSYERSRQISDLNLIKRVNLKLYENLERDNNLLAFELHDDIAQKLALINRYFSEEAIKNDSLAIYKEFSLDIIKKIRSLSNKLRTYGDLHESLKESLEKLFSQFKIYSGIKLDITMRGLSAMTLTKNYHDHIFRIIQELMQNSYKHSKSKIIEISIIYSHPLLHVKYNDHGIGYNFDNSTLTGLGMHSIKYRLQIIGANYNLKVNRDDNSVFYFEVQLDI